MTMKIKIPCFNNGFNDKWLYKFFGVPIYPLEADGLRNFLPGKKPVSLFSNER
jgi:hypothetical protein